MRLYLNLSKNKQTVPFDYQVNLVGTLHKWLGQNNFHDAVSLYSISWLKGYNKKQSKGLDFPNGAEWFISSPNKNFIKAVVNGIMEDASFSFGMNVQDVMIRETPIFRESEKFFVASPIFIKRTIDNEQIFFFHNQIESDNYLTETLKTKLRKMNLPDKDVNIRFDKDYLKPTIKAVNYNGIVNKGSLCPIIIEGTPEQIAFAWDVGVGNSTGIGFGALV